MRHLALAVLLALAPSLGAHAAQPAKEPAGPSPLALAHYEEGSKAYDEGRYAEALDSFTAAYDLSPLPGLLFNIGQCHRQLKQHEKSVEYFERYLKEETDPQNRPEVEEMLAEERAAVASAKPASAEPAAPVAEAEPLEVPQEVWIGAGIGAAALVVLAVGGLVAAVALSQPPPEEPEGNLGTYDLRGGS
jgi:tetratricopeptide (TPR) repeat protein